MGPEILDAPPALDIAALPVFRLGWRRRQPRQGVGLPLPKNTSRAVDHSGPYRSCDQLAVSQPSPVCAGSVPLERRGNETPAVPSKRPLAMSQSPVSQPSTFETALGGMSSHAAGGISKVYLRLALGFCSRFGLGLIKPLWKKQLQPLPALRLRESGAASGIFTRAMLPRPSRFMNNQKHHRCLSF